MTTKTAKKCVRCNGRSSKVWHRVDKHDVGVECLPEVQKYAGDKDLVEKVRNEYKEMMRVKTVTGMILSGFLQLPDMLMKKKITVQQFIDTAEQRYRKAEAEAIVKQTGAK